MRRLLLGKTIAIAAFLVPVMGGDALRAQGGALLLAGDQDLQFGVVLPGLTTLVPPTDPANAARFEIRGSPNAEVVVQFSLPSAMVASGGASMTLSFHAGDGRCGTQPSIRQAQSFDPTAPLVSQLSRSGRLYIWVGGTAHPVQAQEPGDYSAAINVSVAYTGNL